VDTVCAEPVCGASVGVQRSAGGWRAGINRAWRWYNAAVWRMVGTHVRTSLFDPHFLYRWYFLRNLRRVSYDRTGLLVDVGCGQQPYQSLLPSARRIGIDLPGYSGGDPAEQPIVQAYGDAATVPLRDAVASAVVAIQVLEHVPDPRRILKELYRILAPGGRVIVTAPQSFPMHGVPYDFYRYTEYGLRHLLREAGFVVNDVMKNGSFGAYLGLMINVYLFQHVFEFRKRYWVRVVFGLIKVALTPALLLVVCAVNLIGLFLDAIFDDPYFTSNYTVVATKPVQTLEASSVEEKDMRRLHDIGVAVHVAG